MKTFKIFFITLICISAFESNASTIKLDKSELIKEMSNNKIVETYVGNILSLALFSSSHDVSKLSEEHKAKMDNKIQNTIEYGKSIELFFPAYGNLNTVEKKEVMRSVIQQVAEINLFKVVTQNCGWKAVKQYAFCCSIVSAGSLAVFLGCALVCAIVDALVVIGSGGTLTAGVVALITVEFAYCGTFVTPITTALLISCGGEFVLEIYRCD